MVSHSVRSGAYQGHLAEYDVNELGKLVDAMSPQNTTDSSHPLIILFDLNNVIPVLEYCHRPEFENLELTVVETTAALAKYYRTFAFDCYRSDGHRK